MHPRDYEMLEREEEREERRAELMETMHTARCVEIRQALAKPGSDTTAILKDEDIGDEWVKDLNEVIRLFGKSVYIARIGLAFEQALTRMIDRAAKIGLEEAVDAAMRKEALKPKEWDGDCDD